MTLEQQEPEKALSLADELQALPPSGKNPFVSCPKLNAEWQEVKKLLQAGKLSHISQADMLKLINKKFNLKISQATFWRFLKQEGITKGRQET